MIISRTPLRVSLAGGGTDLKSYYKDHCGAVTSTAINKYIYVTVNKKFDDHIRVSYSKTEIVEKINELQHELVREAMKLTGVDGGIEITTIADVPSQGTGLGSSSTLTVGLLNALYAYKGILKSPKELAEEACQIEINILGKPIGKQDQYIAAFGGLQHIQFNKDDSVFVDPVVCPRSVKDKLQDSLLMFYTGITRSANGILSEQTRNTPLKVSLLHEMKKQADQVREKIISAELDAIGRTLHLGWELKKQMAEGISSSSIDHLYERALGSGALGGKILGAGGGGFLMVYCPKDKQERVRKALVGLQEMVFSFEPQGSKIIHISD